ALRGMDGVELVGAASGGAEALRKASRRKPEVVVMDLLTPKMSGLEFAATLKRKPGAPRVVLVSLDDDPMYRQAAREFGADAVLHRGQLESGLPAILRKLFPGRA